MVEMAINLLYIGFYDNIFTKKQNFFVTKIRITILYRIREAL